MTIPMDADALRHRTNDYIGDLISYCSSILLSDNGNQHDPMGQNLGRWDGIEYLDELRDGYLPALPIHRSKS